MSSLLKEEVAEEVHVASVSEFAEMKETTAGKAEKVGLGFDNS